MKINSFKDLEAWEISHQLVIYIYKLTQNFPKSEMLGLSNQLRRAAVSITSNIAEGFSRQTIKDKINFYHISLGSLAEVDNRTTLSTDLNYITSPESYQAQQLIESSSKLIYGLIRSLKKKG